MAIDKVTAGGWGAIHGEILKGVKGLNPEKPQMLKVGHFLAMFPSDGHSKESGIGLKCFSSLCQHGYKLSFRVASLVAEPLAVVSTSDTLSRLTPKLGNGLLSVT